MRSCFQGFNATVLAYGQTGAGKTFTMAGGEGDPGLLHWVSSHIGQLAADHQRSTGEEVEITTSGVEIYQEALRDLSPAAGPASKVRLCETKVGSTEVAGLVETRVASYDELHAALTAASESRSQGCAPPPNLRLQACSLEVEAEQGWH